MIAAREAPVEPSVDRPAHGEGQCFVGELVDDVQQLGLPTVESGIELEHLYLVL